MVATPSNSFNQNSTSAGLQNWDGVASPSTTALVQYNVPIGASTSAVHNEAPGAAGQVLTSNGASSYPSFQVLPFTQTPLTDKAISFSAAAGNGYFVTANATATLPAGAQGNIIYFAVDSVAGILTIQAASGQTIRLGKTITAATGTAVSNFNGDRRAHV